MGLRPWFYLDLTKGILKIWISSWICFDNLKLIGVAVFIDFELEVGIGFLLILELGHNFIDFPTIFLTFFI